MSECAICGRPENEHHEFERKVPPGCVCAPHEWDGEIDPPCDDYIPLGGPATSYQPPICERCSHDKACHRG